MRGMHRKQVQVQIQMKKSIEDIAVDPLINQISWVVKNVFEPARIDKVLDDMFLEFAKRRTRKFWLCWC